MTKFGTVVACMDGRVQGSLQDKLKKEWDVDFVDTITRAGAVGVILRAHLDTKDNPDKDNSDIIAYEDICRHIEISLEKHESKHLAIAGHADCAGHPVSDNVQKEHINRAAEILSKRFSLPVEGIWSGHEKFMPEIMCTYCADKNDV